MIKIEIRNRWTGSVLFEYSKESNNVKDTLIEAVKQCADLQGADLRGADLQGAHLRGVGKIKVAAAFTGLYKYIAMSIIAEDGRHWIRLGCYTRLVSNWENYFWNNDFEFPNDGSKESKYRLMAYNTCKQWLEINSCDN